MHCPYCLHKDTSVVDSRLSNGSVRRRRECDKCEQRFTTYERVASNNLTVIKRNGSRESFQREKLLAGILKACEKLPVRRERIERMTSEIEAQLRRLRREEIASKVIGALLMDKLKELDEVAYVRFASVYKKFRDAGQFAQAAKEVQRDRARSKVAPITIAKR